jgi:nitrogen fixation protein NifU and related proteins
MTNDLYQEIILEEYTHPKNVGHLDQPDATITEANASCGDQITVFLKIDSATQKITEVSWVGVGCAISMATASILSEHLKGRTIDDVMTLTKKDLESMVGIDEIAFGRQKCLTLALNAFRKAVAPFNKNK